MITVTKDIEELIAYIRAREARLTGCTEAEIETLEAAVGGRLPEEYREFLKVMGRNAGHYFVGSDCFYVQLPKLTVWARTLLQENRFRELPPDAFVFWMHQGYQFAFIRLQSYATAPQVYYFIEGQKEADFQTRVSTIAGFFGIEAHKSDCLPGTIRG